LLFAPHRRKEKKTMLKAREGGWAGPAMASAGPGVTHGKITAGV